MTEEAQTRQKGGIQHVQLYPWVLVTFPSLPEPWQYHTAFTCVSALECQLNSQSLTVTRGGGEGLEEVRGRLRSSNEPEGRRKMGKECWFRGEIVHSPSKTHLKLWLSGLQVLALGGGETNEMRAVGCSKSKRRYLPT